MMQSLFNGFVEGMLFALVGVSFSLIYSITRRVLFIALGAIYTLAPYVLTGTRGWGWPLPICVVVAVAIPALVSVICERFVHWPLERRQASSEVNFIASLGCFLVLGQLIVLLWGDSAHSLWANRAGPWVVHQIRISKSQVLSVIAATSALLSLFLLFSKSHLGMKLRGLSANPPLLSTLAIDVPRLRHSAFALSGALVAIASLAKSGDAGFDPHIGMSAVVVGMVATIIGGRAAFCSAAIAGVCLGVLRGVVEYKLTPVLVEASTFAILALVLLFAPLGFSGFVKGKRRPEEE
jgi:branched-chain amino acid transport system permease protein